MSDGKNDIGKYARQKMPVVQTLDSRNATGENARQ